MSAKKSLLALSLLAAAGSANAGYEVKVDKDSSITFGGYIAVDARLVSGDIGYKNFWPGSGTVLADSATQFNLSAKETRFNAKMKHGEVTGFLEFDFYGTGGNEIISNSYSPRLRHAYISYKDVLVGQTWSTLMNTSSLAETADFGGPHVAEPFVRNTQIRYTTGNWQFALENPESYGGNADTANDALPDLIAKYTTKGDWGNISVAGLFRQLNSANANDNDNTDKTTTAAGVSIAGRINTVGKDDIRFTVNAGKLGRYVGTTAAQDLVGDYAEKTTAFTVAYRHFWTETVRSTVFYGNTTTDLTDANRSHVGVNLFKDYTPKLSVGAEIGQFAMDKDLSGSVAKDADSVYAQLKAKFAF